MVNSLCDQLFKISEGTAAVSLLKLNASRQDKKRGELGCLLLEKLNDSGEHEVYCIGQDFTSSSELEITKLPLKEATELMHSDLIDCTSSFRLPLGELESITLDSRPFDSARLTSYSLKKAISSLKAQFNTTFSFDLDEEFFGPTRLPVQWNPFAILFESREFPTARFSRLSFMDKLKDLFSVLNGSDFATNRLGVLDFLYPLPRLLGNIPGLNSITGVILYNIFSIPKYIVSAALSFALSPIVGLTHLAFKWSTANTYELDEVEVLPITGDFEDIGDVAEQDLLDEVPLSSYVTITEGLTIKPIAKKSGTSQYKEVSHKHEINPEEEEFALGLYEEGTPRGVINFSALNEKGLFSLMERNQYHIDETLEQSELMDEAKLAVKPKDKK